MRNTVFFGICLFFVLSLSVITANAEVESPKKQSKMGIEAKDITCKKGLYLVIRNNGVPMCLKETTAYKLEKTGILQVKSEKIQMPAKNSEQIRVPASIGSVVNFYLADDDLNLAHNAVETVSTVGLFEFTINGVIIQGPPSIVETGPDTGEFFIKLELPDSINGKAVTQDNIVLMRYFDSTDYSGNAKIITKSIPLTRSFAKVQTLDGGSRIGHDFTVRLYESDANLDSENKDRIPLDQLEYKGKGGIRTTLANPSFSANSGFLIETGKNTGIFEVIIEIPRTLNGKLVGIGDWYEIRYLDNSTPSSEEQKIIFKGKIG